MNINRKVVISSILLAFNWAWAGDSGGLQLSASGDIWGRIGNTSYGEGASGRIDPREVELTLFAPVDHLFEGNLSLAAHRESGQAFFEIHEATLSTSTLIPRTRVKVGQYFLGIGRLNRFHRHDWPFISAPKVHSNFFGEEGVLDSGIEVGVLLPLPFYLDLSFGVTNGWTFGHSHSDGTKPQTPTHYLRLETFAAIDDQSGIQAGLNYLGRTTDSAHRYQYLGLDLTGKQREGKKVKLLVQSEVWYRIYEPAGASTENTLGFYVYPQIALGEDWSLGLRGDYYSVLSLKDALDRPIANSTWAAVPTLTFQPSEFTKIRLSPQIEWVQAASGFSQEQSVEFQFTFILGAHPAHDF